MHAETLHVAAANLTHMRTRADVAVLPSSARVETRHQRVRVQLAENECAVQYGRCLGFDQCVRIARGCGACSRGEMKVVVGEDEEKDQVDHCDGRGQGAGLDGQADEAREDRIAAQAPFSS